MTVHGRALPVDVRDEASEGFKRTLLDVYIPRYGPEWEQFLDSGAGLRARSTAERMFTFSAPPN